MISAFKIVPIDNAATSSKLTVVNEKLKSREM